MNQDLPDRFTDDIPVAPAIARGVDRKVAMLLISALKANEVKADAILQAKTKDGIISGKALDGSAIFDFEFDLNKETYKVGAKIPLE